MSDLDRVASATLFTDQNKDLLAKMLEKALLQPLVPMEPAAAQKYMERVAAGSMGTSGCSRAFSSIFARRSLF